MYINSLLGKRYPFIIQKTGTSAITSLSISLMIVIFQPFGFNNFTGNKILAAFGFGLVTFLCLYITNTLFKKKLLKKRVKKWVVAFEMIYTTILLLLISIMNSVYLKLILQKNNLSAGFFFNIMVFTVAIGVIPVVVLVLIKYNHFLKTDLAKIIDNRNPEDVDVMLAISSINQGEKDFSINLSQLLFIESVKNNVHVYYYEDGVVKTKCLRNTLTSIFEQISNSAIFRCHRSFIINSTVIKTAKGNSNGYRVLLKNYEQSIPVSRSYTSDFQKMIY